MQRGDLVTRIHQNYPHRLRGTPDGRIFYKVTRSETIDLFRVKTFYIGRWRRKGRSQGRSFNINKRYLRLATDEERAQLAMALFME